MHKEGEDDAEDKMEKHSEYQSYRRSKVYVIFNAITGELIMDYGNQETEFSEEIECEVHRPDDDEGFFGDGKSKRKVQLCDMLLKDEIYEEDGRKRIAVSIFLAGPIMPLLENPNNQALRKRFTHDVCMKQIFMDELEQVDGIEARNKKIIQDI